MRRGHEELLETAFCDHDVIVFLRAAGLGDPEGLNRPGVSGDSVCWMSGLGGVAVVIVVGLFGLG
ncbi:hypothetical protein ACFYMK_35905, partial [Streptomyces sp. NPDC007355]